MEKISETTPGFVLQAKEAYRKIGTAKSPALCGSIINFSNVGFDHLTYKRRIPRSNKDQRRRFALLPYAKKIIESHRAAIFYRQEQNKNTTLHFWAFHATANQQKIKVIVSQLDQGKLQFLSIMDEKIYKKDPRKESPFVEPAIS